jgi:putative endonuclease
LKKISHNLGNEGEDIAKNHLLSQGYEILETNWRFKKYEIDIISKKDNLIVFVEVKSRSSDAFGEPEVFVSAKKQRFLISAAHQYILQNNIELESRFDVIAILVKQGDCFVNQIEGAFYPVAF